MALSASPLLKLIMVEIPEDDAFVVQLACELLHSMTRERFEHSDGFEITPGGVERGAL